jgi:hypothetical protein
MDKFHSFHNAYGYTCSYVSRSTLVTILADIMTSSSSLVGTGMLQVFDFVYVGDWKIQWYGILDGCLLMMLEQSTSSIKTNTLKRFDSVKFE